MARKVRNAAIARDEQKCVQTIALMQNDTKIYQTALYVRLSVLDSGTNNSQVIENQISFLQDYAKNKPYLSIADIFVDNGQTGTNFERPGFYRLMEAVKAKKINCILIKDLSRLGRNYIETGNYIDNIFPLLGVRLIAVNEGLDTLTLDKSGGLIVPLKNLINDAYAKDISRKISSAMELKIQEGDISGGIAPYGYQKNGKKFEIDPETAETVRYIFKMRADGKSYHSIARILNEQGIPSPSAHRYEKGLVQKDKYQGVLWKRHVLSYMLSNRVYLGELTRGKTKSAIYKGVQRHMVPIERCKIFPDAHEAIIDEELFQKVQNITDARKNEHLSRLGKHDSFGREENLFGKKAVCADCGAILTMYKSVRRQKAVYYNYICPNFMENRKLVCTNKNIRKKHLEEAVLEIIKHHVSLFINMQDLLRSRNTNHRIKSEKKVMEARLRELRQQIKRSESLAGNRYIDYKDGLLTEKEYLYEKESYLSDIQLLKEGIMSTEKSMEALSEQYGVNFEIARAIESCFSSEKLTKEMVDCFIEKVAVYMDDRVEVILRYQDEIEQLRETGI